MKTSRLIFMLVIFLIPFTGFSQPQCSCASGQPGNNLVSNPNFNSNTQPTWNVTSPGAPVWSPTPVTGSNTFGIGSNPTSWNPQWCGGDHTSGTGNMLIVDAKSNAQTAAWGQNVGSITPNTTYIFTVWLNNLVCTKDYIDPVLQLRVNGVNIGSPITLVEGDWIKLCGSWVSPALPPATTTIEIIQTVNGPGAGKDFAVDDVSFAACPPPIIANAGNDDMICTGYATQLYGSSTGATNPSYSWAPATGLSCTNCQNPIAAPLVTTTYTLTVTSGTSTATDAVTVDVYSNCCNAGNNDLFQMITSNITISANTYYSGKYYVAPGVIITVSGASLDLTNVDMVFSPCSGIELHNGAKLNANNSVLRPCDVNLWWLGVSFFEGSTGTVNSCTFENALKALEFNGTASPAAYCNITNNLFLNCRKGVKIVAGVDFIESITNNVFTVDFNQLDYSVPNCSSLIPTPNEYHCIEVIGSKLGSAYISQNQFINNQVGKESKAIVSGIYYSEVSGGAISQNTFTNLYRDIDADFSTDLSIENNEMELLQLTNSQLIDYQIRLTNCSYIWVTGNHFVNSKEVTDFSIQGGAAIYTEANLALNIKDNIVDGANNGFISVGDYGSSFTGNSINGINQVGILLSNLQQSEVNCNQIHIQRSVGYPFDGAGIYYVAGSTQVPNNTILSNCIFDAAYAIALSPYNPNLPGPVIANNYLYNYTQAGILNYGYIFNLGSGVSTYAVSGHNTFISNTAISGTVSDIASSTPVIAYGNYGIATVFGFPGPVTTVGNNVYSSTAACGQQIGPYANNQGDDNICDLFFVNLEDLFADSTDGKMMLSPAFEETVNASPSVFSLSKFTSMLQLLQSVNPAAADKLFGLVEQHAWLTATEFSQFKFYHHLFAMDFAAAAADLVSLNGSVDANWFAVKSILVNHMAQEGSLGYLNDEELLSLKTIEQSSSPFAGDARELLQATVGGYDYHFKVQEKIKGIEAGAAIVITQAQLNIYPNPAHDEVAFQYVLPDGLSEARLALYDLSGKLIETQKLEAANSVATINIQNLSNGTYLVALEGKDRILLRGKLVKD